MKKRHEVSVRDTWDICDVIPNEEVLSQKFNTARNAIAELSSYQGKLHVEADLLKALKSYFNISELIETIYTHCNCRSDVDVTNDDNKALLEKAKMVWHTFSTTASYIRPELLSCEDAYLSSVISSPDFEEYNLFLDNVLREKSHILSKSEEAILSLAQDALHCSRDIFSQLNNGDLVFEPVPTREGNRELCHSNYIQFLHEENRETRQIAYSNYMKAYELHKYTLASTYLYNLKKDSFYTKVRKFNSTLERYLFQENITAVVYNTLIDTISSQIHTLHSYYEKRSIILGLENQYIYDTHVNLANDIDFNITYDEAVDIIMQALSLLGDEYCTVLYQGLTVDRWVDKYANSGKKSGAYSSGSYKTKPYILMNYENKGIDSLFTLAHEAGHSMHSYLANTRQPYAKHSYTIFVAEIASTLNEILVAEYLLKLYKHDSTKTFFITNYIVDMIKSTFFRQSMFAEYEREIHGLSDANEPITMETLRSTHFNLQKKYFGPTVTLSEIDGLECFRIPHFYSSFYVYKYATGIASAFSIAMKILDNDEQLKESYLDMLSLGGSMYPLDLLKQTNLDLERQETFLDIIRYFDKKVATLTAS